jgi:hypothetical protein
MSSKQIGLDGWLVTARETSGHTTTNNTTTSDATELGHLGGKEKKRSEAERGNSEEEAGCEVEEWRSWPVQHHNEVR